MLELAKACLASVKVLALRRFLALLLFIWIADSLGVGGVIVDGVFAWHDAVQVPFEEKMAELVLWLHLL